MKVTFKLKLYNSKKEYWCFLKKDIPAAVYAGTTSFEFDELTHFNEPDKIYNIINGEVSIILTYKIHSGKDEFLDNTLEKCLQCGWQTYQTKGNVKDNEEEQNEDK